MTLAATPSANELSEEQLQVVFLLLFGPSLVEEPIESPLTFYQANIAQPVVGAQCINCHVSGGFAGNAGLLFRPGNDEANVEAIRQFNDQLGDGGAEILSKTRGVGHPVGQIFSPASSEYEAFAEFMAILSASTPGSPDVQGEGFFDGVTLASAEETLRRAALILTGRLPTEAELALARSDEQGLRQAVLGLMTGPGFHDFLIRGANDRLHTDGFLNGLRLDVEDLDDEGGRQYPVGAATYLLPENYTPAQDEARRDFQNRFGIGIARAPLELIAHIVENNRPYTEIVTADYTMVNPYTAEVYRSDVTFSRNEDHRTFKPGRNRGLVVRDDQYTAMSRGNRGWEIFTHGAYLDYPHAGILNEPAWLNRYPSTDTNRNRARARWTYYHFLGVDIEKSAPRTTDPDALADINNPTLLNSNCTVCHNVLDPVAGAYQNYGDEGMFRDFAGYRCNDDYSECEVFGGQDALPRQYKFGRPSENPNYPPYQPGDLWYRDMLSPGVNGSTVPANRGDDSLAWLGQQISQDSRFATAAVRFWWPALMGRPMLDAPVFSARTRFDQAVAAFEAQQLTVRTIADDFRGNGYQLKQVLADLVISPWFRTKSIESGSADDQEVALAAVGVDRLLTPEELEAKTEAVLGYAWDKRESDPDREIDGFYSSLGDRYRLYYGGIDSENVLERSTTITTIMANVAERQALEMACGITALDFLSTADTRELYGLVEKHTTPLTEINEAEPVALGSYTNSRIFAFSKQLSEGQKTIRVGFNNDAYNSETGEDRNLYIDSITIIRDGSVIRTIEAETLESQPGFSQSRSSVGRVHRETVNGDRIPVAWALTRTGSSQFTYRFPTDGDYRFEVRAWGTESGDGVLPEMAFGVDGLSTNELTRGAQQIRAQIRALYAKLLGSELPADDPEIEAAYGLLLDTWLERQTHEDNHRAWNSPAEECLFPRTIESAEWSNGLRDDDHQMVYAWTTLLYYLLSHFDYLHE